MHVVTFLKRPIVLSILFIPLLIGGVYGLYSYQRGQNEKQNPPPAATNEIETLIEQVGTLVELPDEEPTIATVTDKERLKDQPFFARAAIGDKVLIYTQAKKAVLYRPSTHKVIEIAPLTIGTASATPATGSAQPAQ